MEQQTEHSTSSGTITYISDGRQKTGSFVQRARQMRARLGIGQPKLMPAVIQSMFRNGLPQGWGQNGN